MRNNILATRGNAIRMTLTIDMELGPHYVAISNNVYKTLDLASNLVVINRAPSIKNTCIYVLELLSFENPEDMTIHVNPWILEGLHADADADGDELAMYYFKREGEMPTFDMELAVTELKRASWKYGNRTNMVSQPRYHFPQHFKYFTFKHDKEIMENNSFYKRVKSLYSNSSHSEQLDKMMAVGCTIMRDEFDDFIDNLLDLQQHHKLTGISFVDIFNKKRSV